MEGGQISVGDLLVAGKAVGSGLNRNCVVLEFGTEQSLEIGQFVGRTFDEDSP